MAPMDTYTLVHVILSLIGIVAGLIVLLELFESKPMNGWTLLLFAATIHIPALHALAPNGSEPPFAIVQGIVLVLFLLGGVLAARQFHPKLVRAT